MVQRALQLGLRQLSISQRRILLKRRKGSTTWTHARVAKLADALDLGSCALNGVGVQVPPLAVFIIKVRIVQHYAFGVEEPSRILPPVSKAV